MWLWCYIKCKLKAFYEGLNDLCTGPTYQLKVDVQRLDSIQMFSLAQHMNNWLLYIVVVTTYLPTTTLTTKLRKCSYVVAVWNAYLSTCIAIKCLGVVSGVTW